MHTGSQLLALGILSGCSTALLVGTPYDDEPAAPAPADASPISDASRHPGTDAGPVDAAVREAAAADAARGPVFPDAAISACSQPNPAACPAQPPSAIDPCLPALRALRCVYAGSFNRSALDISLHQCELDAYGRYLWSPAPCQWNCAKAFEHSTLRTLPVEDCATRPLQSCTSSFLTPQQAVDDTLHQVARECGLVSYGFSLTLSPQGCPQRLGSSPSSTGNDPSTLQCVVERLLKVRFDCTPACAVATGSLL